MPKIVLKENEAEVRYANWIKMLIDLIKPTNLYLVGGRGVAKSTEVLADRAIDVIYDMPRSSLAFISDTYVNLQTNIIPAILTGWERKDFMEGIHYVLDQDPPAHWPLPYVPGNFFKHTISTFNGCRIFLKSLDRPSINAGISVAHIFGDEAKYLKRQKLNKALPTLRGDALLLERSHFFMGQSFCTDMPNTADGEDDWIMDMEKKMDKMTISMILQTALVVNEINLELFLAQKNQQAPRVIETILNKKAKWEERLRKVRSDSSFFYIVSSLANIDILTLTYITNLFESMDFDEFKTSVLSIRTSLRKSARFYFKMNDNHYYSDGYDYDFYDRYGFKSNITQSSKGLRYCQHNRPLEAGFDPGNMMSLVIFQEQADVLRFMKNFYTLTPAFIRELADQFILFFKDHQFKKLLLHTDRAANQYSKAKEDFATKLKQAIEWQDGKVTGWKVVVTTKGARNIEHAEEYNLANAMFECKTKGLPKIMIDAYECKEMKSSLEMAPMERNNGRIQKVKKSEKLPLIKLPMESTNFSDAFKAAICQPKFMLILKGRTINISDPKIRS